MHGINNCIFCIQNKISPKLSHNCISIETQKKVTSSRTKSSEQLVLHIVQLIIPSLAFCIFCCPIADIIFTASIGYLCAYSIIRSSSEMD